MTLYRSSNHYKCDLSTFCQQFYYMDVLQNKLVSRTLKLISKLHKTIGVFRIWRSLTHLRAQIRPLQDICMSIHQWESRSDITETTVHLSTRKQYSLCPSHLRLFNFRLLSLSLSRFPPPLRSNVERSWNVLSGRGTISSRNCQI